MRQSFSTQPALFAPQELFEHPALCALDEVEALIDWSRVERHLPCGAAKRETARPGYPAQTLFRALLLGLWYDLSDVKLSAQLARDLLFRKFCRLELDQGVPDATTIGRFRVQLGDRLGNILPEIVTQLEEARVILAEGRVSIVDGEGANTTGSRERLNVVEAAQCQISTADPEAGNNVRLRTPSSGAPL